ncbi:four-carbon acid sugar kinase family protein [Schnuerera sp. xch1]|uniref:four-carbon acid sugar kinase family protein n=1 Tax=Schnuerera sp. xch1 TaxID=2874283 RepID=UPI001CBFC653|nr:four-carbon acid sugar kinase family protein [Schnuerera sp. xch1]MBZ2174016.1 four-carbon acid sugar kinase family protein [Schnuerera sp. xch1]
MNRFVIVADDLTGANATCSMIKKTGLQTASLMVLDKKKIPKDIDVLAASTGSRAMEPEETYDRVRQTIRTLKSKDVLVYNKRTDSTLRGNLGPEINAVLDELGDDRMAIAVPAYPDTGRIVFNGEMLVNGVLLENSDAGRDAKAPVDSSNVEYLFSKNFKGKMRSVFLKDISKGPKHIEKIIKEEKKKGTRLLIFDSVTNNDISIITKAVFSSKVDCILVDPGPFTLSMIRESLDKGNQMNKVLMTVGSVTDATIEQLEEFIRSYDPYIVNVSPMKLIESNTRKEEIERAVQDAKWGIADAHNGIILLTTTPLHNEGKLDLKTVAQRNDMDIDDASLFISTGLAEISKEVLLNGESFAGIFVSGGDITVALCEQLEAIGVEIKEEIIPLAAYGRLIGGEMDNLRIISKGGMVGDKDAMEICVERLRGEMTD